MRTLVIDTASEACSVALVEGSACIAGDWRMLGRGHAENLIQMVAMLPQRGRADRIAVAVGPGSFTGIRVGIAAGRALAFAWGARIVGYPSLTLIAAMARAQAGSVPVGVVTTGGHGEWFVARFGAAGDVKMGPVSLSPAAAIATCTDAVIVGNQASALVQGRGHGRALELWPDARSFTLLRDVDLLDEAVPIYGRSPDAKVAAS